MKRIQPRTLRASLEAVMNELGLSLRIKQMRVLEIWVDVVGKQIADVTTAERIVNGKLTVRVSKAPWRNELVFLKKDIIAKLNRAMGEEIVKDIIFR